MRKLKAWKIISGKFMALLILHCGRKGVGLYIYMASKQKHIGKCNLCGEVQQLSFEHVPPKSAFNNTPVFI